MKISLIFGVIAVCLAATEAKTKEDLTPAQTPLATMPEAQLDPTIEDNQQQEATPAPKKQLVKAENEPTIAYDKVVPFPMTQPNSESTVTEKAAIKFRPKLNVVNGCHPYPAVNTAGQVSNGLEAEDPTGAACKGSKLGTQVYGRSAWFGRVWAIMYAWYFPDVTADWEHVIVWTNNPNVTNQVILAVTVSNSTGGYTSQVPPDATMMSGKSVKVSYNNNGLESTTEEGGAQNLILWHQLTAAAQEALNDDQNFDGVQVPVNDDYFLLNLGKAWPFE